MKKVKLFYHYLITHFFKLCLIPLTAALATKASQLNPDDLHNLCLHVQDNPMTILTLSVVLVFGSTLYVMTRPRTVYLVDFSCYLPPSHLKVNVPKIMDHARRTIEISNIKINAEDEATMEFLWKINERSGLGDETYLPEPLHCIPPRQTLAAAHEETEQAMFGALDKLFENTKIKPRDIGVLVVNSSLFNPTPSLSAKVVNKYKMRGNIKSFSLGGMGCSAGVIAIDLAKDMLLKTSSPLCDWPDGTDGRLDGAGAAAAAKSMVGGLGFAREEDFRFLGENCLTPKLKGKIWAGLEEMETGRTEDENGPNRNQILQKPTP